MSSEMNQRYIKSQMEITDLIAEAVVHASARRNQVLDAQESLSELSDEEEKDINGGFRIIFGYFPVDIA
ncbi:hypothetical protein PQG02_11295 [Nostoc sp. UHCC 0926]|uniref:hypothetical protein n=1 Tax=unclassified Nostoc TaxID=2593658 RepID=UPI002360C0EA|nr:hypothetical protein [Nostoc sp. UHCC 0926]WDD34857.1 hypothetical protein PQG02_11295 [Nostoc sp. UHCC 0926]